MKKFLFALTLLFAVMGAAGAAHAASEDEGTTVQVLVVETEDYNPSEEDEGCDSVSGQKVKIRVLTDNYLMDKEFTIRNIFENDYYKQARYLRAGDKVEMILYISEEGRINYFYILNKEIYYHAIWLAALFLLLLIIIGRKKGLKSAISLALTLAVVIFVLLPLLKNGYPPVLITILSSIAVTILTMLIVGGISSKSISAILGTMGGLLAAWLLSSLVARLGSMTSLATAEVEMLMYSTTEKVFNLRGILLSGIIIGCLGAIMDVAMSISSSIHQIKEANPDLTTRQLFKAGMEVGFDIIGTMANTLVLAYTGSALTMLLVQSTYNYSIVDLLNHDFIFVEVLRTLAGSIGMILTVPFTALLASKMGKNHRKTV